MLQRQSWESTEEASISESTSDYIQRPGATTPASSLADLENVDTDTDHPVNGVKRGRLSEIAKETKERTKRIFKARVAEEDGGLAESVNVEEGLQNDPAFSQRLLAQKRRRNVKSVAEGTLSAVQTIGKSIVHPKDALKSKATKSTAAQLSKAQRPYLSQKADLDLLQAHDNLKRAASSSSSLENTSDEEYAASIRGSRDRVRQMEEHRDSMRAAWSTSRHVRRVRVVPKRHIDFPEDQYFKIIDQRGIYKGYKWLEWLGFNLLYYTQDFCAQYIDDIEQLPFDIDSSRHYVERLLVASAPWQSWIMNVRSVYRWENKTTTGNWFALYLVLWYTQHVMGFIYGYIIYIVVRNYYAPTNVDAIRATTQRALDSRKRASKIVELIDRHGGHDWLEPVLEEVGPYAQLQLSDLANLLEIAREDMIRQKVEEVHINEVNGQVDNEYIGDNHSVPQITINSGLSDPPDDESFDDDWHSVNSTTSILEGSDIRSFRGLSGGSLGRLIVYSKGIRFVNSIGRAESWRMSFLDLKELRKSEGTRAAKLLSLPDRLEIKRLNGSGIHVEGMKKRDDAFNSIIAFSGLQWQSLQILRSKDHKVSTHLQRDDSAWMKVELGSGLEA
ncbi:uncharacterized protein KY384_005317 [Bacidia gigantensis]|uniref:uncharacterized protein n=1 Tax=Bacidia gigantensis TaxID=2732470 RepID=UPI001D054519|nr:uncharacterized protein KY384_005317 [Bacidia gigantensis]KAG8529836.1 hypothetical protein KY384_005317 [Bacidia gigantensis]